MVGARREYLNVIAVKSGINPHSKSSEYHKHIEPLGIRASILTPFIMPLVVPGLVPTSTAESTDKQQDWMTSLMGKTLTEGDKTETVSICQILSIPERY